MKKTYRTIRGLLNLLFLFIILSLALMLTFIYPILKNKVTWFQLPSVSGNPFLLIILMDILIISGLWSYRNKIWYGLPYACEHYKIIKNIRRQMKGAHYDNEREFDNNIVRLPKIRVRFDDNKHRKKDYGIHMSAT